MRECTKCGKEKAESEFSYRNKRTKGRLSRCNACASEYHAAYRKEHLSQLTQQKREYYQKIRESMLAERRRQYAANREKLLAKGRAYVAQNRERVTAAAVAYNQSLKMEAFLKYGGPKCACCGEMEFRFLSLDHMNGRNSIQRKTEGSGGRLFSWLKANKYPPGLQVMCFNCNLGRRVNGGACPHQKNVS